MKKPRKTPLEEGWDFISLTQDIKYMRTHPEALESALNRYESLPEEAKKRITREVVDLSQDEIFCGWAGIDYHNCRPQDPKLIQAALANTYNTRESILTGR